MEKLPVCPHCNKNADTYVNGQWHGPAQHYFDAEGKYCEASTDKIYATLSKVVKCANCGKIRTDLVLEDNLSQGITRVIAKKMNKRTI